MNIDAATRTQCPDLKHFVCFSSVSGGFGNAGQSNYAFANCYLDELVHERKSQGFSGLSVQWGAIGQVGMYAKTAEKLGDKMVNLGDLLAQPISSMVSSFRGLMLNKSANQVISCRILKEGGDKAEKVDLIADICKILGFKVIYCIPL